MIIAPEQLGSLKELQNQDQMILALKTKKSQAPELIGKLDQKVQRALEHSQLAQKDLESFEMEQMKIEEEIEKAKARLERAKEKLENITNDHEFKAATKEVAQIGEIIKNNTSELPVSREGVRIAKEKFEYRQQVLEDAKKEREACPDDVGVLCDELDSQIRALGSEREKFVESIDKNFFKIYEKARTQRGGIAMAAATGGKCSACNVKIRPQLHNQVLMGKLEECQSCRRLLYAG